jgi:hypothetical protein
MSEPIGPGRLTEALLAPPVRVDPIAWRSTLNPIPEALARLAARQSGGGPWRLTDHQIRQALAGGSGGGSGGGPVDTPFAWSARTARRSLGLTALRLVVAGSVRSPADGVRQAVEDATRWARLDEQPRWSLDRWLAGLTPAGRAAVGAEAVTWATRLWCALDWPALGGTPVIGRDQWWESPHSSLLALRSRADVRTGSAQLVTLTGPRRDTVRAELSVVALVEALRAPDGEVPGRVVGWWPESGHLVRVDVEPTVLTLGVSAVTRALLSGRERAAA